MSCQEIRTHAFGARVEGKYAIEGARLEQAGGGRQCFRCVIRDNTGMIAACGRPISEEMLSELQSIGFAWISGRIGREGDAVQLELEDINPAGTPESVERRISEIRELLGSLEDPAMRAIADEYLGDQRLATGFCSLPADPERSSACSDSLLERTWRLMKGANALLQEREDMSRDMVLLGLFLHGLSKAEEHMQGDRVSTEPTTAGYLVGAAALGATRLQLVAVMAKKHSGHPISPQKLRELQHIIISCADGHAVGAMRLPMTEEAGFVHEMHQLGTHRMSERMQNDFIGRSEARRPRSIRERPIVWYTKADRSG